MVLLLQLQSTKDYLPFRTCGVQEVRAKFESMSHGTQLSPRVEFTERLIGNIFSLNLLLF